MRVLCLQHVGFEGPACIADWAERSGHELELARCFEPGVIEALSLPDVLVVLGGPMSTFEEQAHSWLIPEKRFIERALGARVPVLGICLGAQLLAEVLGARVYRNCHREIGWFPLAPAGAPEDALLDAILPLEFATFHWHGDTFDIPDGGKHMARSHACDNQAFVHDDRVVGLQFHMEATPGWVAGLIDRDRGRLVDAPYIQSAEAMLAAGNPFELNNARMTQLLERLARLA